MAVQIYHKVGNRYKLNVEGLNSILKNVEDLPVAVYSVCGPLRQGKSFLLSVFLRYLMSEGRQNWIQDSFENFFTYRSGTKPETTGIYMWGESFILQKCDGSRIALLLLDSQGSFDNQTDMQENAIVFALCSLLSSQLIFNIKNQISEDILQFLQFFTGFTRLGFDENMHDMRLQKLLFLVRDFEHGDYPFGYYDDEVSSGVRNFKRDMINPQWGSPAQIKYVHEMILELFDSVAAYLMPHPGKELAQSGTFDLNKIEPEFAVHLEKLTSTILNPDKIVPKVIAGQVVTGRELKVLAEGWANAFAQNLPETKILLEATAEVHHEMAKDAAINNYDRKLKKFVKENGGTGLTQSRLLEIHRQLQNESIVLFKAFKKIGNNSITKEYLDSLPEAFQRIFNFYNQYNKANTEMTLIKAESDAIREDLQNKLTIKSNEMASLKSEQESEKQRMIHEIEQIRQETASLEAQRESKMAEIDQKLNELRAEKVAINKKNRGGGGILGMLVETFMPLIVEVVTKFITKRV